MAQRKIPMEADLDELRKRVLATARESSLKDQIHDITLESASDDDGSDFLRVFVELKQAEKTPQAELLALLEAIEEMISGIDDRYPSVRFAEAA